MSVLASALQIAIKVHVDQRDKQGAPYLLHVLRVVESVSDEAKVVAALHDVLEDGPAEIDDLPTRKQVARGLTGVELLALGTLTRRPGDTYKDYIHEIAVLRGAAGSLAREVKIADLKDNLDRIPQEPTVDYPVKDRERGFRHDDWIRDWSGLKRRYERALATLEGSQG
jgi:(p)ppGpp synthase/HD superfamily hydrolase